MARLRSLLRRPSAPMLVALLALFVALGGPAEAKRLLIGSKQVRDHSLKVRDLSRKAVKHLRSTPNGSVTEAKIRNGAVTPGKLARGAVGSAAIADRSVGSGDIAQGAVGGFEVADGSLTGADVRDGTLDARDFARFWGHFSVQIPRLDSGKCWRGDPVGLAPERSHADISGDVILVTPSTGWPDPGPDMGLTFLARASSTRGRFTLTVCNPTSAATPAPPAVQPFSAVFNYAIVDVP